jgi:hypothetical protein
MSNQTSTLNELLQRAGKHAGPAGQRRLAALVAATTVPARAGELDGEAAALVAFRAAHLAQIPERRRRLSMLKTTLAKLLTVKVGALCAATLSVGGVAVAASTGALPGPLHHNPPSASASHPSKRPSGVPSVRPSHPATPPPGILDLCHRYIGKDQDHRRRALDEDGFKDLVGQAGGKDRARVDRFCDKLVHDGPSGVPRDRPTTRPSEGPAGRQSGRPNQSPDQGGWTSGGPNNGGYTEPTRSSH